MNTYHQYYEILGLKLNASPEEVKKAYRNLVKIWHPDRFSNNSSEQKKAEEKFKAILEAYEALKDYQPELQVTSSRVTPEVSVKQSSPQVHYQEGVDYAEKQLYEEAIEEFSAAIRLNPNYLEAYQYRGFILSKLGLEMRAEADFRKATELKLKQKYPDTFVREKSNSQAPHSQTDTYSTSKSPWQCTRTLMSHANAVSAIAISKDGRFFASASHDNTIKLWQLSTEQALFTLRGHTHPIRCLTFSPDGNFLISGSSDRTIKIWDLKTKNVRTFGNWLSGHSDEVLSVAISPDGRTLVSGSADKTVKIWQLSTGKELFTVTGSSAQVSSVAISPDGKTFVSGGLEKHLRIRDINTGKVVRSLKGNAGILSLTYNSNGLILATGGFDRAIKLWNVITGKEINTLTGHLDRVSAVLFSPDGNTLISGSWDKTIKLWQVDRTQEICTLKGHLEEVLSVAISPNGKTIISGSGDNTIKIWRL